MRRLLTSIVAAAATLVPVLARADNPNQQMAQQIATHLQESGKLSHFKIAVKFKDGTAWLEGEVRDAEQATTALRLASEAEGVECVVNHLTIVAVDTTASVKQDAEKAAPAVKPVQTASVEQDANKAMPTEKPAAKPEQEEKATRAPSRPEKPMLAFLTPFRRPSAPHSASLASSAPAEDTQNGARRVPASFASAPAQRVAATEPIAAEEPPKTMAPQGRPIPVALVQTVPASRAGVPGGPLPMCTPGVGGAQAPTRFDVPNMPNYAWPSYASYPNYAAVTYPRQYSATAWPYIGPFYPYPQVPLGWRKVTLQWDDGWWFLNFKDEPGCCWWR